MLSEIEKAGTPDLSQLLASLRRDYSILSPRIRTLEHSVKCDLEGVSLRLHYPSLRQGKATVNDLVDAIALFLIPYALPRARTAELDELFKKGDQKRFEVRHLQLQQEAINLFKTAQRATKRNGEAGELLLYLLTEWILEAPQLLAKMSLKTNREMPVHGADGIHVKYCPVKNVLELFWGEAKIYKEVGKALAEAASSISISLKPETIDHEIKLVERNIDLSGLDKVAKEKVLKYLDPLEEDSNDRVNIITCLIAFDFDAFEKASGQKKQDPELAFKAMAEQQLSKIAPQIARKLRKPELDNTSVELFFFPFPAVDGLKYLFQKKIGWKV